MLALSAGMVSRGALTVGDVVAIHGLLLQLHAPLASLGYSYQEIRQSSTAKVTVLVGPRPATTGSSGCIGRPEAVLTTPEERPVGSDPTARPWS